MLLQAVNAAETISPVWKYTESGFAMSLRALQNSLGGKLHGAWNLFGMRDKEPFPSGSTAGEKRKFIPRPGRNFPL